MQIKNQPFPYISGHAIDEITGAVIAIDYSHHEIHEGNHFMYTDAVELDSAATQDYMITTPNTTKYAHMVFVMDGSAITQWQLYESGDRTGTTGQTISNSDRNSTNAATVTIHKGTSAGTTDGNVIHLYKGGSDTNQSRSGAKERNEEEIILKANTKYILRVTSGTDNNLTNVRLSWYEHTSL